MTMCAIKTHYAIAKKAKAFRRFDEGKRPLDIDDVPVTRRTLYQYYGEWRRERGIAGKRTGFALTKFDRKAYLEARERERRRREKRRLGRLVMDWEVILEALGEWDGDLRHIGPKVYLPGSERYRWLNHMLRRKKDQHGKSIDMTREENLRLYAKWVQLGKKAQGVADFKRLCDKEGIPVPAEI